MDIEVRARFEFTETDFNSVKWFGLKIKYKLPSEKRWRLIETNIVNTLWSDEELFFERVFDFLSDVEKNVENRCRYEIEQEIYKMDEKEKKKMMENDLRNKIREIGEIKFNIKIDD